ncbi:MAG: type III-B CRISPR module-associated protein Cmr5 [Sulfuritalea sp.]|nr:type III-B CRISPR module-associated protein Cmr5 [Sulfuritalea sp.]
MSKMTLEQQRSQAAWAMAQEGIALAGGEYTNLAKAAPALIMNNGLMQTLAFYADKDKAHHKALAGHMRRWIVRRDGGPDQDPGFQALMGALLKADSARYRQATEEALLLLRWIRQFAAALGGK